MCEAGFSEVCSPPKQDLHVLFLLTSSSGYTERDCSWGASGMAAEQRRHQNNVSNAAPPPRPDVHGRHFVLTFNSLFENCSLSEANLVSVFVIIWSITMYSQFYQETKAVCYNICNR